jgi:hypothetical protein
MQTVTIPVVLNDEDFELASRRLEELVNAPEGTAERFEANTLWLILDDYQRRHHGPQPDQEF